MNVRKSLWHTVGMGFFTLGLEREVHRRAGRVDDTLPRVSTKGHFRVRWGETNGQPRATGIPPIALVERMGRVELQPGHTYTDYDVLGDFPEPEDVDELTVFVHGWLADPDSSLGRISMMRGALHKGGDYEHDVVGFTWDSDGQGLGWRHGNEIAAKNGGKLAQFTYDYGERHDVPIRYVTNSAGARPALEALRVLQRSGERDAVESVSMLGAAVDSRSVARGGRYYKGVRDSAKAVHNYWIRHDGTLNEYYRAAELEDALGGTGAKGETPDGYEDHNVNSVPDHFSYFRKGHGCIERVVEDFERTSEERR
ncbi:MAG: hypothetical protein ACOCT0_05865 [Halobacteriota archaeon]